MDIFQITTKFSERQFFFRKLTKRKKDKSQIFTAESIVILLYFLKKNYSIMHLGKYSHLIFQKALLHFLLSVD